GLAEGAGWLLQDAAQRLAVVDAVRIGREAWVREEVGQVERLAEALPHRFVRRGHVDVTIAGLEHLVRGDAGVAVADAARRLARREVAASLIRQQRYLPTQHRRVDQLAAALRVALAPEQCRGDGE